MEKIFLDCGSHHLEGLVNFLDNGTIDTSYKIHCFEANPECFLSERVKNIKYKELDITIHNKAVWVEDGTILFNQENHNESRSGSPSDGKSNIDGWGSSVSGINFKHPGYSNPVEVESIDFSRFVSELPTNCKIVCKLDIEGSEFEVLEKMLLDGTIDRISEIYIEFHERFMSHITLEYKQNLISRIRARVSKLETWI